MKSIDSVRRLDDDQLLGALTALVRDKRRNDAAMVEHIAEVDRRRLFAREGYPSMFAYCTGELKLSEQATYKRIRTARLARRFPVILGMLAAGELHLAGLSALAVHLTDDNHRDVLGRARGKTCKQIEKLVAELAPKPDVPGSIRNIPGTAAPKTVGGQAAERGAVAQATATEAVSSSGVSARTVPSPVLEMRLDPDVRADHQRSSSAPPLVRDGMAACSGAEVEAGTARRVRSAGQEHRVEVLAPQRYLVKATFGEEARAKLAWARDLLCYRVPDGDIARVLELGLDELIATVEKERFGLTDRPRKGTAPSTLARNLPAAVKRGVVKRDGFRCIYVAASGRRCEATRWLQFHHIQAFAKGGPATVDNICLLCHAHNQHAADLDFGRALMDRRRHTGGGVRERQARWCGVTLADLAA